MTRSAALRAPFLQYGFLAVPTAFAGYPLYVMAPDLYATQHGVSLTSLGMALLGIRLFDAVQDPLIGACTDRLRAHFRLLLCFAGLLLCLSIAGLFNFVPFSPLAWFTLCMVMAVSAYSILTIIMGATATLWAADEGTQTKLAGTREFFGLFGLMAAVTLPSVLGTFFANDAVYLWYVFILAVLAAFGIAAFINVLRNINLRPATPVAQYGNAYTGWLSLLRGHHRFFQVYALGMLASSVPVVLVIFYVRDFLQAGAYIGLFMLLYFLSGAVSIPLWRAIALRAGRFQAWGGAKVLAVTGFIGALFLAPGDIFPYAAVCVASGIALGADLILPPAILAQHVHTRGQLEQSGVYYSLLVFTAKACLALASVITLMGLDRFGFHPGAENTQTGLMALVVAYALIPCIIKMTSAFLLYLYFIRPQKGGNNENSRDHHPHRSSLHV